MVQYLFSINTGRSGSKYLSKLLSCFEHISSQHEPEPIGNGNPMISYNNGDEAPMLEVVREKIQNIERILSGNKSVYSETSHTFIKGFGWLLAKQIPQNEIGVVILRRNEEEIINSLQRIGTTPLTQLGRVWILSPDMKNNLLKFSAWGKHWFKFVFKLNLKWPSSKLLKSLINTHERRYLKWYIDEQEARTELFKKTFPEIKYFETDIQSLNDEAELIRMFDFFEIPYEPTERLTEFLGKPANLKRNA